MVETHAHFVKRLNLLGRKHQQMTHGYVTKVGRDGLITVTPKRQSRSFPVKGLLLIVLGFFAFKAFTLSAVGPVTYNERLSELGRGTVVEKVGAKALAIDPVTQSMANAVGPVLR
tara:strand:+ start:53781 stop:54125 length:345 start_codon:yes stop_codon:yes gene_type:complete